MRNNEFMPTNQRRPTACTTTPAISNPNRQSVEIPGLKSAVFAGHRRAVGHGMPFGGVAASGAPGGEDGADQPR